MSLDPHVFLSPSRAVQAVILVTAGIWLMSIEARAEQVSFTNLMAQGELAEQHEDVPGALKFYSAASSLAPANCAELCRLTKDYCDLMHGTSSPAFQKELAKRALATAFQAVKSDAKSATAHLCVAVCYVKNFPYADNGTKVKWSRNIKTECETAILLDPKQDLSYYLLGRWNVGVVNMNLFVRETIKIIYGGLPKASDEEAINDFKKAIELAPNRIINHFELAKVYEATDQPNLALVEFQKCRMLKPLDRDDADAQRDANRKLARSKSLAP